MLPKILLITISLLLAGCRTTWLPDTHPKQISREGFCNQYKLNYGKKLTIKFEKTITMDECTQSGNFVITRDEFFEIRRKYNEERKP